jgi:hypothetical protein
MYCRNCGTQHEDTAQFCPSCGVAAAAVAAPAMAGKQVASSVGLTQAPGNGMGVAGFCCGLVGLLLNLSVILFVFGSPLCVLGIVFGVIGRNRAKANPAVPHGGLSLAGAICGGVGLAWIIGLLAIGAAAS